MTVTKAILCLHAEHFAANFVCLGVQLAQVIDALSSIGAWDWYIGSDFELNANEPEFRARMGIPEELARPVFQGSGADLAERVRAAGQFFSAIFLAVPTGAGPPTPF